jgi:hypothetical protein
MEDGEKKKKKKKKVGTNSEDGLYGRRRDKPRKPVCKKEISGR